MFNYIMFLSISSNITFLCRVVSFMSLFIWRVVFYFVWFMCSPLVSYEFLLCGQIKKMVLHSATSALEELKDLLSSKYVNDKILLVHCISWWIVLFFFISRKSWLAVQDQLLRSQETLESNTIFSSYFAWNGFTHCFGVRSATNLLDQANPFLSCLFCMPWRTQSTATWKKAWSCFKVLPSSFD